MAWFKIINYHTGKFECEIGVEAFLEDLPKAGQMVKRQVESAGSIMQVLYLEGPPGANFCAWKGANCTLKWGVGRVPSLDLFIDWHREMLLN